MNRRRIMLKEASSPVPNGLLDREVTTENKTYSVVNNQFQVTILTTTSDFCVAKFKYPFEIKTGDTIYLKLANVSGSISQYQKWRLYNENGSSNVFTINDNVSLQNLKTGITVTVNTNAVVGYIGCAKRTGAVSLPAIFTPILKVNDIDMIN